MRAKWIAGVLVLVSATAFAGGPRFLATAANGGGPMAWKGPVVQYFTDPGNLNTAVTHAQADAVVAAAAAVWNVPTSSLTLQQGGVLSEHVSSANVYFDGSAMVFPADVQAINTAKPIAVIYDSDGSVTDLLLGAGASDPSSCRQNEVTESVDALGSTTIDHALLIVNGRCVGASADQLNQLQYMLMRKMGRVLGLAWSQTNDSVFTGSVPTTATLMANWPVMHPIDVICGPFTYLCTQNPFALRPDDLSSLALLYPVTSANVTAGKTLSATGAQEVWGLVRFANGLGMEELNMTVRIIPWGGQAVQAWQVASGVTGYSAVEDWGNPVSGVVDSSVARGADNVSIYPGFYDMKRVPMPSQAAQIYLEMESVNPLYTGAYALLPGSGAPVSMSGQMTPGVVYPDWNHGSTLVAFTIANSSTACWLGTSGSESAPQSVSSTGLWDGLLCSTHSPNWGAVTVKAGRTWTLETTATDETGGQSTLKAQPVLGVWSAGDPVGTSPTVASMPVPMNGRVTGMTQLGVPAGAVDATYRFAVADLHGHGRPDLTFHGRVLYADNVVPSVTAVSGGTVTISGMGFNGSMRVTVNGVAAKVVSWSSTQLAVTVPTMAAAKALPGVPVDVSVVDATTAGSSVMTGALSYPGGTAYGLVKVSAPSALETGVTAATAFAVKVVAADGVTAIPGASVRFAVTSGSAGLVGCGVAAGCTLVTNASGVASTAVSGVSAGSVALTATEVSGGASVQVSLVDADPVRSAVIATPTAYVAAGASVTMPVVLNAVQDGAAASGVAVSWSVSAGLGLAGASTATAADGSAAVGVLTNGIAAGPATVRGCVWSTVCANWSVVSIAASEWTPGVVSGAGQSVPYAASLMPVVLRVSDRAGHALAGAPVTVAQTVTAWEGVCTTGRCAAAPVLASNTASAVTDASGLVTVMPLQVSGVPQVVNVAVVVGTGGFVSLALVKTP